MPSQIRLVLEVRTDLGIHIQWRRPADIVDGGGYACMYVSMYKEQGFAIMSEEIDLSCYMYGVGVSVCLS